MTLTNLIETPQDVVTALADIRTQADKGLGLLEEAQREYVRLDQQANKVEYEAFLGSQGTVKDREAIAGLQAQEARTAAELQKVRVDYIKTKLKHLSEATMAIQTSARMVELGWRTAGIGER
jgi:hypothetical protein